jgi:hypothetical protein
MKVITTIKSALKKGNQNSKMVFYYLKDNDLINCNYETSDIKRLKNIGSS